jgi:hypothetical protein
MTIKAVAMSQKKNAQEIFLRSILNNEDKCWTEFYKYEKNVEAIEKIFL